MNLSRYAEARFRHDLDNYPVLIRVQGKQFVDGQSVGTKVVLTRKEASNLVKYLTAELKKEGIK